METKSNYIFVGIVTLALLLSLALFTIWLAKFNDGNQKQYDIFFKQAVTGLSKGSSVSFAGIQKGQIDEISLWDDDPEFVRVRISVDENTPILQGTVATIASVGFTGPSEIQLSGAIKGAPPITCPKKDAKLVCPAGAPIIPTKPGALGELLNSAPLLLDRLSTLTERLTNILSDKNQDSIEKILINVETLSGSLAKTGPELSAVIGESRLTLQKAGLAADQMAAVAASTGQLIDGEGKPLMAEVNKTLKQAQKSLAALEDTANAAKPAIDGVSQNTLPEVNRLMKDLRDLSASLKSVTEKLENNGAASLVGSPNLPDYKPKK
ncbi:mammalian cell entry protein [Sphingorhabdus lutea]|uniref:Mammalian cell entry protein n=1 Tax=Sphingorhabdus lutea TaxID=1913578 RepID=A0A1L3JB04_9SPHN|nr:MlaD family protein [Sphingorhabdus lutea]APG62317.1 mammalian cell entry protein [Sphingorhabdus lutea]